LLFAASLREEHVDNRHIEKREGQQENRYPAPKAIQSH